MTSTTILVESVIALILAQAVSSIIAESLGYLVARFALLLAEAAAEYGLERFAFSVPVAYIEAVAGMLTFAVIFIGIAILWNWLNRYYTIQIEVFNWDMVNNWIVSDAAVSNAVIAGKDRDEMQNITFDLPKRTEKGQHIFPPGFKPIIGLESVCYYGVVVLQNNKTFMEGLSVALQIKKTDRSSQQGFMWAMQCPRLTDNDQAAKNGIEKAAYYLHKPNWSDKPLNFSIITADEIPVHFAMSALNGADDNYYKNIIHIGKTD